MGVKLACTNLNLHMLIHLTHHSRHVLFHLNENDGQQMLTDCKMLSDGNSSPKICPFKLYKRLTEIFMHCLGSCIFVFSEKESFIHIPIGSDLIFFSCIGSHLILVKNNQYIYRLIYMQKILDTCFLFSNNLPLIDGVTSPNGEVEINVNLENSFDPFYLTHHES